MAFYHYTSRLGAQDIVGSGAVRPGRNGLLYLTDIRFDQGAAAATQLSIVAKPIELGAYVNGGEGLLAVVGPFTVEPVRDGRGRLLRPGGGREYTLQQPVPAARLSWFTLDAP
jgi:hypothetical protein